MKKKIIGISIVILLLALIPSTSVATEIPEERCLILKGTVKVNEIENNTIHGFALRLFYFEVDDTERTMGWVTLNRVTFPDDFFIIPLIGNISFFFGIGDIPLEVE